MKFSGFSGFSEFSEFSKFSKFGEFGEFGGFGGVGEAGCYPVSPSRLLYPSAAADEEESCELWGPRVS